MEKTELICKCGNIIEISVPMYIDNEGAYICKICFNNNKKIEDIIKKTEDYIKRLEEILQNNLTKRKINNQIDLMIDDIIELLQELRHSKKPLSNERKKYFREKLEKRKLAIGKL